MRKERGLLCNCEIVREIIDGKRTQIRKPVKRDIPETSKLMPFTNMYTNELKWCAIDREFPHMSPVHDGTTFSCPFGVIGDILYVRETFTAFAPAHSKEIMRSDRMGYSWDKWIDDFERHGEVFDAAVIYRASGKRPWHGGWIPSTYMPKAFARIWLEITNVKVAGNGADWDWVIDFKIRKK